jgi:hypothetical protein
LATLDTLLTANVTATVSVAPFASVTAIVPEYMPAAKLAGLTVTFKLAGSDPDTLVVTPFTSSQLPVLAAWAV